MGLNADGSKPKRTGAAGLRAENARLQKALDTREQQYIKLLHTGDAILDGVRKLLSHAGFASAGSD